MSSPNLIFPLLDEIQFTLRRSDIEPEYTVSGFKASDNTSIINEEDQEIQYNGPPEKFHEITKNTVFHLYIKSGNFLSKCSKELFNLIYSESPEKFSAEFFKGEQSVAGEYRIVYSP